MIMWDVALTSLVILGNVLMVVFIAERGLNLWQTATSRNRPTAIEAEQIELKAYTHQNVHQLRDLLHQDRLSLEAKIAAFAERLAHLESKIDLQMTSQTETLDRVLKLVEAQMAKWTVLPTPDNKGTS